MVRLVKYCLAFSLIAAFAAPAFAQDDYPKFQLAPGYGNLGFGIPGYGLETKRHSGFVMDTNYNFMPAVGADIFTGYYSLGGGAELYTNSFGGIFTLRKNAHIVPFGTASFGFGYENGFGTKAMATRIGGGTDIPFSDSLAIRVEVSRMGFHFNHDWEASAHYSVGIVLNLTQ
jgi:hypothetical protein